MNTAMAVERAESGAGSMSHVTVDVNSAYPEVKSAFFPYEAGINGINKFLAASNTDDYDNDDLEVQMILSNSFAPIIQEKEMKFFSRGEPFPTMFLYGEDISRGNGENGSQKRYGKPCKTELFVEEKKAGFAVDDADAIFMGYDYYFEDESGFLNGKLDDLPFWRGD